MRILAADVGRGTQDILIYESGRELENSIQLILPSRTVMLAGMISEATQKGDDVVLYGVTMGGGPVTKAARRHLEAKGFLAATPAAAATFSDDPQEVAEMGVVIIDEDEAGRLARRSDTVALETADMHLESLHRSLEVWGVDVSFDLAAVSVQDHGAAPRGESDRRYRFSYFQGSLKENPRLSAQCYRAGEIPQRFTRMRGVKESLTDIERFVVMDTGFAAMLGACLDERVASSRGKVLINIGNGHSLAALVEGLSIRSLFEHHTSRLDPPRFAAYLDDLVRGRIDDDRIFADGGHGAYRDNGHYRGPEDVGVWSITGPRRERFAAGHPALYQAAPFGSMMQCGCYGLMTALFTSYPDLCGPGEEKFLHPLAMEGHDEKIH